MIRAVLDTNVYLSALFGKGVPRKIFLDGVQGFFQIVTSPAISEEIKDRLIFKFKFPTDTVIEFLEKIILKSLVVSPEIKLDVVKDDSNDNKIIECAAAGMSNLLLPAINIY
jgi:putative PIN family toxin of toxin-antitoxin system